MRVLGLVSIVLAVAALYALAGSDIDSTAFYAVLAFACAFIGYCAGSIEDLRRRLHRVERELIGRARTGAVDVCHAPGSTDSRGPPAP